jgi:hypothetical protein
MSQYSYAFADPRYGGAYDVYAGAYDAPAARVAGATRRHRHVGQASIALKPSAIPKFAYHAWHPDFKPVLNGKLHATQLTVHAPTAYAAAKKIVSHMHRTHPGATEKAFPFLMTQQVKLRLSGATTGRGDQAGNPHTSTRIYSYEGRFLRFVLPQQFRKGTRLITVEGESQVESLPIGKATKSKSGKTKYGGHKRLLVPFTHHADVVAAYRAVHLGSIRAGHLHHAHSAPKAHRRLRSKLALPVRHRKHKSPKKAGGSAQADFYDVEPRYAGAGRRLAAPVDPYYYGVDPRVAGAYGW